MPSPRPFALLRTRDQWARAAHDGTEIDAATGGVELRRLELDEGTPAVAAAEPAGLAFDADCRLYCSVPREGRVLRQLWREDAPLGPDRPDSEPLDLLAGPPEPEGDFRPAPAPRPPLQLPRGLAVDCDDRLFVAESGSGSVLVYDLWSRRLLRRVALGAPPLDVAAAGETVFCLLAGAPWLVRLTAHGEPAPLPLDRPGGARPLRLAAARNGSLLVLFDGGLLVPQAGRLEFPAVAGATDVELLEGRQTEVVVARGPGDDFHRFLVDAGAVVDEAPLKARGYDGSGIVRTPAGRIGFWTEQGLREAVEARPRFVDEGTVTTYRLDGGAFHLEWGRLFLDACIPRGCDVRVTCFTSDEAAAVPALDRTPPPNLHPAPPHEELSPPMPALALLRAEDDAERLLYRRETGRELPWARFAAGDAFETYEAPVIAPPGRYLWVRLALRGTGRATPRVRSLRAEHPSHDLLRRLPKTFSRDPRVGDFLRRYLAVVEGVLGDLEGRADARAVLLDPQASPEEALPWLASFLGLTLDERWPEPARRQLIDEIPLLWRCRGTVAGLSRFLELYLGRRPVIVEHFRLRGLGGALLADEPSALFAGAVVGANFRVGGAVGSADAEPLAGDAETAFETHAHRFTVLVPAVLDADGMDVVRDVLETHRPAHTAYDVCTVATGMRVGIGLHVELLSAIGRTGGWDTLLLGGSRLGRDAVVGRPTGGAVLGVDRPGHGMRLA